MSPTRTFAVVLGIVAAACGVLAIRSSDPARARGSNVTTPAAPAWSARRVPQPIVDAVGAQRLQGALDATVEGNDSCFVVDEGGAPLASREPDRPLVPASTEKLLTSAAALATIGPDSTLDTRAVVEQAVNGGTLERLYLVGGGDPLLGTAAFQTALDDTAETRGTKITSLETLADGIVAAGVKRIPGGIVADDSRYEKTRYLPTWKESYRTDGQVGPLGALTVNRGFRAFRPRPQPVDDPGIYAAEELGRLLEDRGVKVGRAPIVGTAPAGATEIAKVSSAPLRDVVATILRISDNLGAELLTREIGFRVAHAGTTAAGTTAIGTTLGDLGLDAKGLALVDGSGLDRGNRTTCRLLAGALALGARPEYAVLWDGLPIAGQSGTLIDELRGTALDGKVRAKTGSLDGVTGLVGTIDVGHPLRFAFLANGGFTERGGIDLRGRVAQIIAGFPDAPSADNLVPLPGATAQP